MLDSGGMSFGLCVQLLATSVCLFHQQLDNLEKEAHENAKWG
jgi:hypothetical protein